MVRTLSVSLAAIVLFTGNLLAQSREEKVRNDKAKVTAAGFWIYNDLAQGFAEAKKTGKPLVVVLRCIPCEDCVKLDDDLVDQNERLQKLLEQFVRVRVVSANGLDLSLFQFDTDQSFAVFLLNADGTIYGRFGTRSDQSHWADDVSIEGLAKALEGALALHQDFPQHKAALAAKKGPPPEFSAPENYPSLQGKFGSQLDYQGNVVRSCIHCHQIGDAQRQHHLDQSGKLPETVMFPYPHPKSIGLVLDPKERATVLRIEPGSAAANAGLKAGDAIERLAGQPLLSFADMQWVLHQVPPDGGTVEGTVSRDGKQVSLTLTLDKGWRQKDDIAWRASSWELRRRALGGLFAKDLSAQLRSDLKAPLQGMAMRVQHVGQYAPHDRAKQAGFLKDDILVSFDGRTDLVRETDLLNYALYREGSDEVTVEVLRDGKKLTLKLPGR
jgi:hypothetical protein